LGHVLPIGSRWRRFAASGASLEDLDASAISFRFAHDRVQQAAYSLNSASGKVAAHLRIGRLLEQNLAAAESENPASHDQGSALFDVVSHLNLASRLMQDPAERIALADLNLRAGRQAKASAGYEAAKGLFEAGIGLLPKDPWQHQRPLAQALHREAADSAYGAQEFDRALQHADLVIAQALDPIEAAPAHYTRVEIFLAQHALKEAVEAGIAGMASLGVDLLVDPSEAEVGEMIAGMQALLAGHDPDAIRSLPRMDDPIHLAAMRLGGLVSVPFSFVSGNGFVGVVTSLIRVTIEHGLAPESAFAFVLYSNILCGPMRQYESGYRLGALAMELVEQMNARAMLPRVTVSFETSVRHWRDHQAHSVPALLRGYQVGVEIGDFEFATLCAVNYSTQYYQSGRPLDEVEQAMQDMTEAIARLLQHGHVFSLLIEHESVDNLLGRSGNRIRLSGAYFDEDSDLAELKAADDMTHLVQVDMVKAKMCTWFGEFEQGVDHALRALESVFTTGWRSTMYGPLMYFTAALNILASEEAGEGRAHWGEREAEVTAALDRCLSGLRGVAEQGAMNYQHKLDLIEAELARLDGRVADALQAFDRAIEGAAANGYMQEEALACERAGRFSLGLGLERIARSYLHLARDAWLGWGAIAKVQQIEADFDWLRRLSSLATATGAQAPLFETRMRPTTSVSSETHSESGTFDLSSAIRATQAISSEIELRSLLATLMQVLVENAGADAGALVDLRGDRPRVAATYRHAEAMEILPGGSLEDNERISAPAVRYVLRTHQTLVLSDALEEGPLTGDRHLRERGVRSLICAPVEHMGQTTAVLYLENSQAVGAFTPARLELLQMLSAQVAISLENAQLYENLSGLNRSFARFVPQSFLGLLDRQDMSEVQLGDQVQLEMTVLFSDVRGFSRRSEGQSPAEVFGLLNTYLSRMVPRIEEHGGLIDKYMGDSIMAIFPEPGGADRALQSALAMLQERDALNTELAWDGGEPISLGIGLHSGPVMLGTIGSEARMDGTIIGDAVNLASRVEGVTKQYGVALAVSEATVSALEYPSNYLMREMDRVKMVGREEPVTVFEVFEADPPQRLARKRENLARLAEAIAQFRAKDIEGCEMACRMILMLDPEDEVAAMYLRRCEKIQELGLSPEDELVTALTEK
jgi:class 3 adenylate cyclase